jgi:hypothetical protein
MECVGDRRHGQPNILELSALSQESSHLDFDFVLLFCCVSLVCSSRAFSKTSAERLDLLSLAEVCLFLNVVATYTRKRASRLHTCGRTVHLSLCSYDNDLRIPFVIRGPGIAAGSHFSNVATQVDTIPTILGQQ